MRILTISGSIRASSSNATLLRAAAALAPADVEVVPYAGLADLPPFDPDLDGDAGGGPPVPPAPVAVAGFRAALRAADAVLISSPEYAHGVPGVLKNALDWVVGSGELVDKPVALVNGAPHASTAQASLVETLATMSARVVGGAPFAVPLSGRRGLDAGAVAAQPELAAALREALAALATAAASPTSVATGAAALSPAELFVARSRHYLADEYRVKIRRAVEALPREAVWARANDGSNSAGNLLLHLAGNVRQWIVAGVGREATAARDRASEFAARDGAGAAELLAALDATLDEADAVIGRLGPGDLAGRRTIQGRDITVLDAVYHVVEHFSLHLGQLVLLAKALGQPGAVRFYEDAGGLARPVWK